jgi:hypothetical protein
MNDKQETETAEKNYGSRRIEMTVTEKHYGQPKGNESILKRRD